MPDVYNDHEVRVHVNRLREFLVGQSVSEVALGCGSSLLSKLSDGFDLQTASDDDKQPIDLLKVNKLFETVTDTLDVAPNASESRIKCLQSLSVSAWNPPSLQQRMKGDLLYLTVTTLEGETFDLTCCASGFHVSLSTPSAFNPSRKPDAKHCYTLVDALQAASPLFAEAFAKLSDAAAKRHVFETIPTLTPASPWLVKSQSHTNDPGRVLDTLFAATTCIDTLSSRDWNEDIQSARELPRETAQERILRDQAVCKAHSDFLEAAVRGAMQIVSKTIVPINPTEEEASQAYIHNNIFFSQGSDHRDQFHHYGGAAAAHAAVSKDIDGIQCLMSSDPDGIFTLGSAIIDYKGMRIIAQSMVPGILKKVSALEQSIDYGSIDGTEISSSPAFREAIEKLMRPLHLQEHSLLDKDGKEHKLVTSLDTKGIVGDDARHYLLDLYRMTPVDVLFLEQIEKQSADNAYPHSFTVLRTELVERFIEYKLRSAILEHQNKVAALKKEAQSANDEEKKEIIEPPFTFDLRLNPDVFTKAKSGDSPEEIAKQEAAVREASQFLQDSIRSLVPELSSSFSSIPLDGEGLTKLLHDRGINMRYLGSVANEVEGSKALKIVRVLCVQEIVARACKHILRDLLSDLPLFLVGPCISHFLNCLFSKDDSTVEVILESPHVPLLHDSPAFTSLTPSTVHESVRAQALSRFRFELAQEEVNVWQTRQVPLLRSIANKVGFQLEAKNYFPDNNQSLFVPDDILNIYPIVKHAEPRASFAEEAFEHGRMSFVQDQKETGLELMVESLSICEQVLGPIHPTTGRIYAKIAMMYFNEGDHERARFFQQRAVLVHERTIGLDSGETIQQYMNLAYFEFMCGRVELGVRFMKYTLDRWKVISAGEIHPDLASALANTAAMLQKVDEFTISTKLYEQELTVIESLFGKDHASAMSALEALTKSYLFQRDYRKAVSAQKEVYKLCQQKLGDEHETTKYAFQLLGGLTKCAVDAARKEKAEKNGVVPDASVTPSITAPIAAPIAAPKLKADKNGDSPIGDWPIERILEYIGETGKKAKKLKV